MIIQPLRAMHAFCRVNGNIGSAMRALFGGSWCRQPMADIGPYERPNPSEHRPPQEDIGKDNSIPASMPAQPCSDGRCKINGNRKKQKENTEGSTVLEHGLLHWCWILPGLCDEVLFVDDFGHCIPFFTVIHDTFYFSAIVCCLNIRFKLHHTPIPIGKPPDGDSEVRPDHCAIGVL